MIRNIVFDMGGVLITFDRKLFLDRLGLSPSDTTLLKNEVFLSVEWARMDRGSMTEETALESICRRLPAALHEPARRLIFSWDDPVLPIEGMEELVRELKSNGYHIFLLSNASFRLHEYWQKIPCHDAFEDILVSADEGLVKPQPEIYRRAFEKFGILPEESLYIDDLPANAEGAFFTGMASRVFHADVPALRAWMRAQGVKVRA